MEIQSLEFWKYRNSGIMHICMDEQMDRLMDTGRWSLVYTNHYQERYGLYQPLSRKVMFSGT